MYVLPSYDFSKNFSLNNFDGSFNFNSNGNNTLNDTNVVTSSISNNLNYTALGKFFDNGIKTNFEIALIFMTQGLLIGLVGSFLGAIIGILGALNAPVVVNKLESLLGFNFLESEVYPIDYLPSQLVWSDVFLVILVAVALNLIVTIYPSLQAAKIKPANELRYE